MDTTFDSRADGPGRRTNGGQTVLVVDDEPDMLENVARILRRGPYVCVTAAGGQQALELLGPARPDLVLIDLRMPGMDGVTLLREIKRRAPATPVVICTAFAPEGAAGEAMHAGVAAFLAKPFTALQLLETVRRTLGDPAGFAARA
jgi:DNA-binding NtrC family response regulator